VALSFFLVTVAGVSETMQLQFERDGDLGTIVLDGGGTTHELDRPDFVAFEALERFFADPGLRGAILRGSGAHFSAGASSTALEALFEDPDSHGEALERSRQALAVIENAPVPVVAAIRGSCLGAGLEIALCCTYRVASDNALLGFPESGLGLFPGLGGLALAQERLGRAHAAELILSAKLLSADEAREVGLVDLVVPTKELEARSKGLLESVLGDSKAHVVRAIMTSLAGWRRLPREEALRREAQLFLEVAQKKKTEE